MLRKASGGGGGRIYLLKDGVYNPIISGFEKKGFNNGSGTVTINSTVSVSVNANYTAATATTILPFNCTGYSKIGLKYTRIQSDTSNSLAQIALSDNVINGNYSTSFIGKTTLNFPRYSTETEHEVEINISGNKYLSFVVNCWRVGVSASITVSEIWIE